MTLNRLAGEPVDLLVNGKPIARGEVVVIDEEFGLRVTEVVRAARRHAPTDGGAAPPARPPPAYTAAPGLLAAATRGGATVLLAQGLRGQPHRPRAMVAYKLMLAIFPLALVALFVAGRVLRSPEVAESVIRDAQRIFPSAAESTLTEACDGCESTSTTVGIVAIASALWVGASFWGALDTAFCRIYHSRAALGAPEAVRAGDARRDALFIVASVAVPTVQALLASGRQRPAARARRRARALVYAITHRRRLLVLFGALCATYRSCPRGAIPWSCVWPGALGATVGDGHRRLRASRCTSPTSPRCGSGRPPCSC